MVSTSKRVSNHILSIQRVLPLSHPNMGLSENSVPLHPMVNDPCPYLMAISLGVYPIFRHTHMGPGCEHEEGELVSAGAQ